MFNYLRDLIHIPKKTSKTRLKSGGTSSKIKWRSIRRRHYGRRCRYSIPESPGYRFYGKSVEYQLQHKDTY